MVKPIVKRSKRRTEVIYNKKQKYDDYKVIIWSIICIGVITLGLGLGLGLGLKKKTTTPALDSALFNDEGYFPIKVIYEAKNEVAEKLLYKIYGRDTLSSTYIQFTDWNITFRNKINEAKILIVFPPSYLWSSSAEMTYKLNRQKNKLTMPYFYHVLEMRVDLIYSNIKENYNEFIKDYNRYIAAR